MLNSFFPSRESGSCPLQHPCLLLIVQSPMIPYKRYNIKKKKWQCLTTFLRRKSGRIKLFLVILSSLLYHRGHEQCELLLRSFTALKLDSTFYFYWKVHTESMHSLKCLDHQTCGFFRQKRTSHQQDSCIHTASWLFCQVERTWFSSNATIP